MNTDAKTQVIHENLPINIKVRTVNDMGAETIYVWSDVAPIEFTPPYSPTILVADKATILSSSPTPDAPPIEWEFDEYYSATLSNTSQYTASKILEAVIIYKNSSGFHAIYDAPRRQMNPGYAFGDLTSTVIEIQDTYDGYMTALTRDPTIDMFAVTIYTKE